MYCVVVREDDVDIANSLSVTWNTHPVKLNRTRPGPRLSRTRREAVKEKVYSAGHILAIREPRSRRHHRRRPTRLPLVPAHPHLNLPPLMSLRR